MSDAQTPREFDRRGFLMLFAGAVTGLPAVANAQTTAAPGATPTAPVAPPAPEHTSSEARLLSEALRVRYPDRFSEAQWGSITGDFDGDIAAGKRLRAVKLANADEPDFTFRP
jgi:hypothetical protein